MSPDDASKIGKTVSVLGHVKENHTSYLLGLLVLYSLGILDTAQQTVGACI